MTLPLRSLAPACLCASLAACGAPPPAQSPQPAAPTASAAPAAAPDAAYSPYTDPSYLSQQNEKNVYTRRTLALLWVASAKADPPGAIRDAREKLAAQALSDAEAAVATQGDPCKAGVTAALERATADKGRLERQYLVVSEAQGETSDMAETIDAQVHILRDAMDELGVLAQPCPPSMFPESDDEPR